MVVLCYTEGDRNNRCQTVGSSTTLQFCLCISLNVVDRCFRCKNGHVYCKKCIGEWSMLTNFPGIHVERMKPLRAFGPTTRITSEIQESLHQQASGLATNTCAVCRVVGPLQRDANVDAAVAALQVGLELRTEDAVFTVQWLKCNAVVRSGDNGLGVETENFGLGLGLARLVLAVYS